MAAISSFHDRLRQAWADSGALLCVGLDPVRSRLPPPFNKAPLGLRDFCCEIVEATADLVCAFKPQAAHFAAEGAEDQLAAVIAHIHQGWPNKPVILDAKRGDIGSTAALYAKEAFERYGADAVTVNPYLGAESVRPFLEYPGRGVAVLCRTSNPGSGWLQAAPAADPAYLRVAAAARDWNENGNVMLVAGATYPEELAKIRAAVGDMPLLTPGIGAQGGDLQQTLAAGLDAAGEGLLINASRSILHPQAEMAVGETKGTYGLSATTSSRRTRGSVTVGETRKVNGVAEQEFAAQSRAAAQRLRDEINNLRPSR